ncbi:MAG: hypothetical protein LBQ39_08730 [Tannerellaceae bacterium]|jgi:hypothetical protein|nr:hypothetical protein [Tannerellaceae bacterium]
MAESKNNVVTHGLSGTIGDMLIFSQRYGKTIVSKVPDRSKIIESEKQRAQRDRFQEAIVYGKIAVSDPELNAAYRAKAGKGLTGYNVAIADMLHAPDIKSIDLSDYTGKAGDVIRVSVTDDFMVKDVKISIVNIDGTLVEEGSAVPDASGYLWTFKATQNNDSLIGDKITVTASDLPGNVTQEEQVLS